MESLVKIDDLTKNKRYSKPEESIGEQFTTIKTSGCTVALKEGLRVEAFKRGRSPDYYQRISLYRMLEELQDTDKDITESDKQRMVMRMNHEKRHESIDYVETIKDAVKVVEKGIFDLDFCVRRDEFRSVAKVHYDSIVDYISSFTDEKVKGILYKEFGDYVDKNIRPSRVMCKIVGINPDRDRKGRFIKKNKVNKNKLENRGDEV